MLSLSRLWRVLAVAVLLGVVLPAPVYAARPHAPDHLYLFSYNGECTSLLSVIGRHGRVHSWEPVGGPCGYASAMAVGRTLRTLPARPGEIGAEYTLRGVATGTTYAYPDSVEMDLPDGTTDGRSNYAGGYFDGTVYRFTRDWTDPVPLFATGLFLGGVTYDPTTRTLWVLDSRTLDEGGLGEIRNYTMDGTLLSSFVVRGGAAPQPFGLAFDARHRSLWISRNQGFDTPVVLEQYSTRGCYRGSVTTDLVGIPGGLEFRLRHR